MARMEKNRLLNILDKSFSFLTPGLSKKTQNKLLFRFLIVWYPLFWFSGMNKDNWKYWVINSYSDRAFLAPCDPGLEEGRWGGFWIKMPVKKSVVNCSHITGLVTNFLTFRVWGGRDNPYATETTVNRAYTVYLFVCLFVCFLIYVR